MLLALGCGGGGDGLPDASNDSGVALDAGVRDAGEDAALDAAAQDAGEEMSELDASVEDAGMLDAAPEDGGDSSGAPDAGLGDSGVDAGSDAESDAGIERRGVLPDFCPSNPTPVGFYRGTLEYRLNEYSSVCGLYAPGRDGFIRVEVEPGQTLRAVYRHAQNGVLYLLDNCPVLSSCLDWSDRSTSGAEEVVWTNTGYEMNPVYLGLDSTALSGPQTFELDIYLTP